MDEHSGFVVEVLSSSDLWVYKLCPTKKTQLVCWSFEENGLHEALVRRVHSCTPSSVELVLCSFQKTITRMGDSERSVSHSPQASAAAAPSSSDKVIQAPMHVVSIRTSLIDAH